MHFFHSRWPRHLPFHGDPENMEFFPLYVVQSRKFLSFQSDITYIFFRKYRLHVSNDARLLNYPKQVACTSERKYMLWLADNLDFIFHFLYCYLTCNLAQQKRHCCICIVDIDIQFNTFNVYAYCHLVITLDTAHGLGFFQNKVSGGGSRPPPGLDFLICWGSWAGLHHWTCDDSRKFLWIVDKHLPDHKPRKTQTSKKNCPGVNGSLICRIKFKAKSPNSLIKFQCCRKPHRRMSGPTPWTMHESLH